MLTCTRCVMNDSSDSKISFKDDGSCNYCSNALLQKDSIYFPNEKGEERLKNMISLIKKHGEGKKYDCIMGLSGGLDSSYLLYLGFKWGLRIAALHVDDGFDSEISKNNIEKLVKATNVDYYTVKPNEIQYNSLVKAYLLASVPNIAAPQDNILTAHLYKFAKQNNIKYFLSGGNYSSESILQEDHVYDAMDVKNLKDIHKKFGELPINKLSFISSYKKYLYDRVFSIKSIRPLNYVDYNIEVAMKELRIFCGFQYYGVKHTENILTSFVQLFWLPQKFNVDKRTSHLSSLIVSGQITRDAALNILKKPMYDNELMMENISIIMKRLNLTKATFERIMNQSPRSHYDYKTDKVSKHLRKIIR